MTSLAMIIGLLPLMFASGVGKNGNQTLGAAAVGGMLIGTFVQIFIVPALFVIFQWLQEKFTPIKFEDEYNPEAEAELQQFASSRQADNASESRLTHNIKTSSAPRLFGRRRRTC
jgi:HAE1 family hydrophobic/amphiphilic exporter-1